MLFQAQKVCEDRFSKSVILHHFTPKFRDLQSGIKTVEDEYFGSRPLCLIIFVRHDHVWINPNE